MGALGDEACHRLRDEGAMLDEGQAEALAWQVLAGAGVDAKAA